MNELSNQLDRLVGLSPTELTAAIDAIEASDESRRTLLDPRLSAERIDDELGERVVLRLDWKRRYPGRPIELVGWLTPEAVR
jgi:hypothetical protein